jgi:hypothetical protein
MAKLQAPQTAGFNAGKSYNIRFIRLQDIVIDQEIASIFAIEQKILEEIKQKIKAFGFNKEEPVVIWVDEQGNHVLVDGRTRYTAAMEAGLDEIPYVIREFESREEAMLYTFERQVMRRNLSNSEILAAVQMIKGRKSNDGSGRAMDILAARLGVSASTLFHAKTVMEKAPPEIKEAVKKGEMAIKTGAKETKRLLNPDKPPVDTEKDMPNHIMPQTLRESILTSSVILLVEAGQRASAELLINHFFKKNERHGFYGLLPEAISAQLAISVPAH